MWPRIVEVMLGCWLVVSPFIFRHPAEATFLWANDFAAGAVVIAIALTACWPSAEKLRLLNLLTALYLALVAYLVGGTPPPPAPYQNYMTLALLLLILAVIPTRATLPPRAWQEFYEKQQGQKV
jgi:peptidoglycan/LPS O-acetylase OafA/YrhL